MLHATITPTFSPHLVYMLSTCCPHLVCILSASCLHLVYTLCACLPTLGLHFGLPLVCIQHASLLGCTKTNCIATKPALQQTHTRELPYLSRRFPSDATRQPDVLRLNCHTPGVDRTQIGVFENGDKICFRSLLQRHQRSRLKARVSLDILGDFTDQALKWKLAQQQVRGPAAAHRP